MHGSAQAVPVWLLVVPFVLLAAEELSAESRGRREDGESNPARAGGTGIKVQQIDIIGNLKL